MGTFESLHGNLHFLLAKQGSEFNEEGEEGHRKHSGAMQVKNY